MSRSSKTQNASVFSGIRFNVSVVYSEGHEVLAEAHFLRQQLDECEGGYDIRHAKARDLVY